MLSALKHRLDDDPCIWCIFDVPEDSCWRNAAARKLWQSTESDVPSEVMRALLWPPQARSVLDRFSRVLKLHRPDVIRFWCAVDREAWLLADHHVAPIACGECAQRACALFTAQVLPVARARIPTVVCGH